MERIDYAADTPLQTEAMDLTELSGLCRVQMDLEDALEHAEELVEGIKERLREVKEKQIPDFLKQTGLSEVRLTDGSKVIVKDQVFSTIKAENQEPAFKWLRDNGFDDIIKNQVIMAFARGEDNRAALLVEELKQRGFVVDNKKTVHPQTLKAFVREQLQDPESKLPHDTFSVTVVPTTKIERAQR